MIKKDIEYAPFSIVGLEYNVDTDININLGSSTANIKIGGQIDRIDRTDYALRIIDYKTGKDELKFKELDDVFNPEKISKTKAIFQTFMYSYIISTEFTDNKIVPMVYSIKGLFNKTSSFEISSDKCDTFQKDGFLGIKADVEEKIKQLLEEIFDINRPFEQTQNIKNCEYCIYKEMCGR
jgi:ATP-dependent helicase/DNAse subunit B